MDAFPVVGQQWIQGFSVSEPDLVKILDLEISKVMERLKSKKLQLSLDEKAKDFLVEKGYDPTFGARPMRRAVERFRIGCWVGNNRRLGGIGSRGQRGPLASIEVRAF